MNLIAIHFDVAIAESMLARLLMEKYIQDSDIKIEMQARVIMLPPVVTTHLIHEIQKQHPIMYARVMEAKRKAEKKHEEDKAKESKPPEKPDGRVFIVPNGPSLN